MAMLNNQMVVSMVYRDESPVLGTSLEDDRQTWCIWGTMVTRGSTEILEGAVPHGSARSIHVDGLAEM